MSEDNETTIEEATEQVEDAAQKQAAKQVSENLEVAEQRIAEAENTAQQLTDAALRTELGRQIEAIKEEFNAWRNQAPNAQALADLASRLETVETGLASLLQARTPETPPQPSSLENAAPDGTPKPENTSPTQQKLEDAVDQTLDEQVKVTADPEQEPAPMPEPEPETNQNGDGEGKPRRRWI